MPWQRRLFKSNKVYARTDAEGNLLEQEGRVEIRYKLTDPRAYHAAAVNLGKLPGEEGARLWADEEAVDGVEPAGARGAFGGRPAAPGAPGVAVPGRMEAPGIEVAAGSGGRATGSSVPPPSGQGGSSRMSRAISSARGATSRMVAAGGHSPNPPFLGDREPIVVYTDGACSGNPGPAGIGVVMSCAGRRRELSEYLGHQTNNIAELTAIKRALQEVKDTRRTVLLHVDSQYSMGVLNGWKVKANRDLVEDIKREMERFEDLRFIKVPGHAGVPENERCDELARDAITRGK
jgi:ribonuclease HI